MLASHSIRRLVYCLRDRLATDSHRLQILRVMSTATSTVSCILSDTSRQAIHSDPKIYPHEIRALSKCFCDKFRAAIALACKRLSRLQTSRIIDDFNECHWRTQSSSRTKSSPRSVLKRTAVVYDAGTGFNRLRMNYKFLQQRVPLHLFGVTAQVHRSSRRFPTSNFHPIIQSLTGRRRRIWWSDRGEAFDRYGNRYYGNAREYRNFLE